MARPRPAFAPELDLLEATRAEQAERRAIIAYAQRESELHCPVCEKRMRAFNYRSYDLELDSCEDDHGFWLDAVEEGRVHDSIDERVRDLKRAASAEASWSEFLEGLGSGASGGPWNAVRSIFRRRR